jgi:ribosomal protein S6E (S10)
LQDIFIIYNDDLEAGRKKIKSVSEVLTALLDPMHEKLSKLLSSGIEGILSKFLTNHCNSEIKKLAQMTKNRIKMAEKFEEILIEKCKSLGNKMNAYFPKGTFKRNMIKPTLNAATQYSVKVGGGQEATIHTMISAVRLSRVELKTTEAELVYLLDKLVKIEEMDVTAEKWRDAAQTWMSLINLGPQLNAERSIAVINCIASDEMVLYALSAAKALRYSIGGSNTIVSILSNEPGRHIRENGYRYQRTIRQEIVQIQKICRFQVLLISFIVYFLKCTVVHFTNS